MKIFGITVFCSFALALSQAQTCDEEGTCSDSRFKCGLPRSFCESAKKKKTSTTIYGHGGTAQAYLPGAPISTTVCDAALHQKTRHLVAGWPLARTSHRSAPRVTLRIHLWSCGFPLEFDKKKGQGNDPKCCCEMLKAERKVEESPSDPAATIEIWQARPDGSYSSLHERMDELVQGDCRSRAHLDRGSASFTMNTVAPGSTGILGGLGPGRWDFPPFGPPVVHVLASASGHAPLLLDIPFMYNRKTLNQKKTNMLGGDWRGSAWMRESCVDKPYDVRKWTGNPKDNRIDVDLHVYLARIPDQAADKSASSLWCPSMLYGLPSSFFLEPIAVCARPLLDFFAL
jgi:hypothetical protein